MLIRKMIYGAIILVLAAVSLLTGTGSGYADSSGSPVSAPKSKDLIEKGQLQRRDLSMPGSRIVLNPYNFNLPENRISPAAYSNRPSLPLNFGYLSTPQGNRELTDAVMLYKNTGNQGSFEIGWKADLTTLEPWNIGFANSPGSAQAEVTDKGLTFSVTAIANPIWQPLSTKTNVTVDLDKTPFLQISVPESNTVWAVKVNDGTMAVDAVLRGDSPGTGIFQYNIPQVTGWKGTKSFQVLVYAVGASTSMTIDSMEIVGVHPSVEGATSYQTEWQPHSLPFKATYYDGTELFGQDFFFDENTVVRSVTFSPVAQGNGLFTLSGRYSGALRWDAEHKSIVVDAGEYQYAISANSSLVSAPVKFYKTQFDFLSGQNAQDLPLSSGYWALDIDVRDLNQGHLIVSTAFKEKAEPEDLLWDRVQAPFVGQHAEKALKQRERFWDDLLMAVPQPRQFSLQTVDAKGVTAEQVKQTYYKAWVFMSSNVVPPDPANGYPYPQVAAGKASLWAYGAPKAPFSASWESFFGIQMLAYVDPETAWQAFKGLMSLVDENGVLGGESLPSRKAQTAMILYQLTGDSKSLKETYPALKRYMQWRMQQPHWIFGNVNNPNEKDAEFVVSALIDMGYMRDIANILGMKEEASDWDTKRGQFFEQYLQWFWKTPNDKPVQYYWTDSQKTSYGNTYWVTTGAYIDLLEGPQLDSLMKRFLDEFDPNKSFGGIIYPKYPDISYTIYGLIQKGYSEDAAKLTDVVLRDIVRANSTFAESYTTQEQPYGEGVRPSLFGAAMMIDAVMLKNGYDYDKGWPHIVRLFEGDSGLSGIRIKGKELNVAISGVTGEIAVSGSFIRQPIQLSLPLGGIAPLPPGQSK